MATAGRGKTKIVAGLLALFLGGFGIHHFYLGSTMAGVICILTCGGCGFLSLIEAILLFVMGDADFDAKYNQRTPESMEFVFVKAK